jgi:hypothetical protein
MLLLSTRNKYSIMHSVAEINHRAFGLHLLAYHKCLQSNTRVNRLDALFLCSIRQQSNTAAADSIANPKICSSFHRGVIIISSYKKGVTTSVSKRNSFSIF